EAHNGYLETYLNLGLIGLFILISVIVTTYRKTRLEFLTNFEWGRFRLTLLAALLLYNWTEAAFKLLNPLWFIFYIIALECPKGRLTSGEPSFRTAGSHGDRELVYAEEETLTWKAATSSVAPETIGN